MRRKLLAGHGEAAVDLLAEADVEDGQVGSRTLPELLRDGEIAIEGARATGAEPLAFCSEEARPEPEAELVLRTGALELPG